MPHKSSSRLARDEAGIVVVWLSKLIVVIGVLGLVFVEAVGIILARYNAAEGAAAAAGQAALGLRTGGTAGDPRELARIAAEQRGCTLVSLNRNLDTKTVFATVERPARTFFIQDVQQLQRFTRARFTEDASYADR